MKSLLHLLCCIGILGALLCGAQESITELNSSEDNVPTVNTQVSSANATPTVTVSSSKPESSSFKSTQSPTTTTKLADISRTSPSYGPQTTTSGNLLNIRACLELTMISGGLILICVILLISTLILACKVCHLRSHIKAMNSNADLISSSEYWMGTAKKSKDKPETEAKETTILMSDVSQAQEEMGNGTTEEEEGKQEGQMEEENKKEVKETVNSEEASTTPETVAENSSPSKPQEDPTNGESTNTEAASSSEDQEKTKDVV